MKSSFMEDTQWENDRSIDDAIDCIHALIKSVRLPSDKYGDVQQKDKEAQNSCEYACLACAIINKVVSSLSEIDGVKMKWKRLLPGILTLCAPLQISINPWSNSVSDLTSKGLLMFLLQLCGLNSNKKPISQEWIFRDTLEFIRPNLIGEAWKESSMARLTFIYLVMNTDADILTEYLDKILPFALTLTDDFAPMHATSGIKCIHHILNAVPPAEIRFRGRGDVLYDALSKKIYTREPAIAEVLVPCLLQSLQCIETEMMRKRGCRIPKHDECFDAILNNFHLSSDVLIKRSYAKFLPTFISRMGVQSIGHMKTFCLVTEYEIETADLIMIPFLCDTIIELVNVAWPRMANHTEKFVGILIKTLYSVKTDEWRTAGASQITIDNAVESIIKAIAKLGTVSKDLVTKIQQMMKQEKCLGLSESAMKLKQALT